MPITKITNNDNNIKKKKKWKKKGDISLEKIQNLIEVEADSTFNKTLNMLTNLSTSRHNYWDREFIEALAIFEKRSKCVAKQVCCILVKNNNILSIGLNGSISGHNNCCDVFQAMGNGKYLNKITDIVTDDDNNVDSHHYWSKFNEIHAEINAIKKATQNGHFDLKGATAYVTYCPCFNCSKTLSLYGIKRVVYKHDYDNSDECIKFLKNNGIEVVKYD